MAGRTTQGAGWRPGMPWAPPNVGGRVPFASPSPGLVRGGPSGGGPPPLQGLGGGWSDAPPAIFSPPGASIGLTGPSSLGLPGIPPVGSPAAQGAPPNLMDDVQAQVFGKPPPAKKFDPKKPQSAQAEIPSGMPTFQPVPLAPPITIPHDANLSGTGPALPSPGGGFLFQPGLTSVPDIERGTVTGMVSQSNPYPMGSPEFWQFQREAETFRRQQDALQPRAAPPTWLGMIQQAEAGQDALYSAIAQAQRSGGFPTTSQRFQMTLDPTSGQPIDQQNPHPIGSPEYIQWALERFGAYQRFGQPLPIPGMVSMFG